jgi:protein gp37
MIGKYWDKAWSLVDGCTHCSPGCQRCWSAALAHRFESGWIMGENGDGDMPILFTERTCGGPRFNGNIQVRSERLSIPLKRKKPTVYAVWNDLFHEAAPVNFLEDALAVMTNCPQHTFLVLTKRAQRLNLMTSDRLRVSRTDTWPITNLWLGLTVCNQQEADEKIPVFLQVPGKKFLSLEPLLGPVDLVAARYKAVTEGATGSIDAVFLGGETGPGARPMQIEWARSIRDQCQSAGVPFFLKSLGERVIGYGGTVNNPLIFKAYRSRLLDGRTHDDLPWRRPK